jgi:hypothetical protein
MLFNEVLLDEAKYAQIRLLHDFRGKIMNTQQIAAALRPFRHLLFAFLTIVSSAALASTDSRPSPHIIWEHGLEIVACLPGVSNASSCGAGTMPASVGTVRKVIAGQFLSTAGASWLVIATRKVSLCSFGLRSKNIQCRLVGIAPDYIEYDISFIHGALYFSPRIFDDVSQERTKNFAARFATAVSKSALQLQTILVAPKGASGDNSSAVTVGNLDAADDGGGACAEFDDAGSCVKDDDRAGSEGAPGGAVDSPGTPRIPCVSTP